MSSNTQLDVFMSVPSVLCAVQVVECFPGIVWSPSDSCAELCAHNASLRWENVAGGSMAVESPRKHYCQYEDIGIDIVKP